jgi:HTH-type transcriptional regulator/antitoxin MqsA
VCSIRKSLKLTQIDAGVVLGGGPRAFQKYGAGITTRIELAGTNLGPSSDQNRNDMQ